MTDELDTDLYALLGVQPAATGTELDQAFRVLARELHPDNGGDSNAFQRVLSAYAVLRDPVARSNYDRHRASIVRRDQRAVTAREDQRATACEDQCATACEDHCAATAREDHRVTAHEGATAHEDHCAATAREDQRAGTAREDQRAGTWFRDLTVYIDATGKPRIHRTTTLHWPSEVETPLAEPAPA